MTSEHFKSTFFTTLGILIVLSLPFALSDLDLSISMLFYKNGWIWGESFLWSALYHYGTLPGLLLAIGSLSAFCISLFNHSWKKWKQPAIIILLTLLLGPGLLVNVIGKGYWGRPRPREVITFNGTEPFHRWTEPGIPGKGKSFPSGHPSVGYLFCVFFLLDSRQKQRWIWLGLGVSYGTLMGLARVIQGGHFASDVLWSGGFTFLSAIIATYTTSRFLSTAQSAVTIKRPHAPLTRAVILISLLTISLGVIILFLLATPFYKEHTDSVSLSSSENAILLTTPTHYEKILIQSASSIGAINAKIEYQGFGFPKLTLRTQFVRKSIKGSKVNIVISSELGGWTTEKTNCLTIQIPPHAQFEWDASNPKPGSLQTDNSVR